MSGKQYTPRRANLKRWLQGAPPYVLDVFDSKEPSERYTVFFGADYMSRRGTYAESWVSYLGMSGAPSHPQGVSMWGEMSAHDAAMYRYRHGARRVRWGDLPADIRAHVTARATREN